MVKCGLTVEEFFDLSWYEAHLIGEQFDYREQSRWLHTRMIVQALTGEAASTIMPLPLFDSQQQKIIVPSDEEADAIINKYKHFFK